MIDSAETKRRYDVATVGRGKTARGPMAVVLAGALLIALGGGGPASAASRGFTLDNKSNVALKLYAVEPVPAFTCVDPGVCHRFEYPIDFEGRPDEGSVLNPGRSHRFELRYTFDIFGGVQYAANLWYKIHGTTTGTTASPGRS
jgi:hypothetical protein